MGVRGGGRGEELHAQVLQSSFRTRSGGSYACISIGLGGEGVVGRVVAVVVGSNGHCPSSSSQQAVLVVKISTAVRFGRV